MFDAAASFTHKKGTYTNYVQTWAGWFTIFTLSKCLILVIFNNFTYGIFSKNKIHGLKNDQICNFDLLKLPKLLSRKICVSLSENLDIFNYSKGGIFSKNENSGPPKWPKLHFNTSQNHQIWFHIKYVTYVCLKKMKIANWSAQDCTYGLPSLNQPLLHFHIKPPIRTIDGNADCGIEWFDMFSFDSERGPPLSRFSHI